MPIELSQYLVDRATDVTHEKRTNGLPEAPIPALSGFFVTTDASSATAYLGSVTVDGTEYFICQRMNF